MTFDKVVVLHRMRWIYGKTCEKEFKLKTSLDGRGNIDDKNWLRLLVYGRSVNAVVKRSDLVTIDGSTKRRGRLQLSLEVVAQEELDFRGCHRRNALDSSQWRKMIDLADPN